MKTSHPDEGARSEAGATAAQLFEALWAELVSVLGTTAAATLVRRAAKRACAHSSELKDVQVVRDGWEYRYSLPAGWESSGPADVPALAQLVVTELVPLLREFTGQIVVRRLQQHPALRELGLGSEEQ